jgi:ribose-phosphate pyrophosphokinase
MAPYLPYMRQDKAFHEGEAITSRTFAKLLSGSFDWLVTVDPHLHRYGQLSDIYTIPAVAASAAEPLGRWIAANVEDPLIIGPDSESAQWVKQIADRAAAPYAVLSKTRRGDYDVDVEGEVDVRSRTPVLVDDVISSARTMAEAVKIVRRSSSTPPVCVSVHALFAGDALDVLQNAGISLICTTDTIEHVTNRVSVAHELARAIQEWSAGSPQSQ